MNGEVKPKSHKKFLVGIIIVVVILVVLFIPMIPVSVAYDETEPYNRLAKYEITSATKQKNLSYSEEESIKGLRLLLKT